MVYSWTIVYNTLHAAKKIIKIAIDNRKIIFRPKMSLNLANIIITITYFSR